MRKFFKNLLIILGAAAVVVVALNFDYFWQNLKFTFEKPQEIARLPSPAAQAPGGQASPPNILEIASLGIEVPVIYVEETSEAVYQKALERGVVHFPGTALPGELGNVYIFGHSSDNPWSAGDYKTVFALLPRIQNGAEILLSDSAGQVYKYEVTEHFVAGAKDVQWLDQKQYQKRLLTLQTSYPLGTSLKRYIVIAEMKEN